MINKPVNTHGVQYILLLTEQTHTDLLSLIHHYNTKVFHGISHTLLIYFFFFFFFFLVYVQLLYLPLANKIKMIRNFSQGVLFKQPVIKGPLFTRQVINQLNNTNSSTSILLLKRFNTTQAKETIQGIKNGESNGELPSDKIVSIVNEISQLTLLETSELIKHLQRTLNLPSSISGSVGMINPIMMAGQNGAGIGNTIIGGATGSVVGDTGTVTATPEEAEQTTFTVKLTSFDTKSKAKIIKEIKSLLGLSLVEAKKFVEASPRVVKEHLSKEESETLKSKLESLGAKIELE